MKNIALGTGFVLSILCCSAFAEEQSSAQDMAPTEEQCKAMAEQHGMEGDELDAWVERCMEMSSTEQSDGGIGEENDVNDMQDRSDMEDPQDGDSEMDSETN
jgi:hypothetical protein